MIKTRLVGAVVPRKKVYLVYDLWQGSPPVAGIGSLFYRRFTERVVYRVVTVPIIERTILILVLVVVIRFICERMGARSSIWRVWM